MITQSILAMIIIGTGAFIDPPPRSDFGARLCYFFCMGFAFAEATRAAWRIYLGV